MAEASGGRTHPRYKIPHAGFEVRARHRPGLASIGETYKCDGASSRIVTAWVKLKRFNSFLFPDRLTVGQRPLEP